MKPENEITRAMASGEFTDAMIRLGLIALMAVLCFRIFTPFLALMVWALILAIILYPLHQRLARRLGGKQGRAATVIVVVGVLLIGIPLVMLGESFAVHIHGLNEAYENQTLAVPQPDPGVADWPVVGKRVYAAWQAAATNLPAFVETNNATFKSAGRRVVSAAANTATSVLLFLGSLIVAGIMMAWGESGSAALRRILRRLSGPAKGPDLQKLSTMTVRSVAAGVIGTAFIQALLLGVGFKFAGVPGAGVLALAAMIAGILQLPPLIIALPVVAYLWVGGDGSTAGNIVWSIYLVLAAMADNVLKPLLLGRGVDAPMPVVLIGALGGMISAGLVGLFVGSVVLALGYQLFMEWVGTAGTGDEAEPLQTEPGANTARAAE